MTFKVTGRYFIALIAVAISSYVFIAKVYNPMLVFFMIVFIIFTVYANVVVWKIEDNIIRKYCIGLVNNEINIVDIIKIDAVIVKQIGTIYFSIGKTANKIKEDGYEDRYYVHLRDGFVYKINSCFRNKEGITLGRYLEKRHRIRFSITEKYKWSNNRF